MKKTTGIGTLLIAISILLSSCGTKFSLMQRHYRDGYYIAHNSGKQKGSTRNVDKSEGGKDKPEQYVRMHMKTGAINPGIAQKEVSGKVITGKAKMEMTQSKKITQTGGMFTELKKGTTIRRPVTGTEGAFRPVSSNSDGLSWFWTIIVIILIIWLIGYLLGGFGLGGLINVLLLVALILLILWLLRII